MSLLMEALKKAEQAKRAAEQPKQDAIAPIPAPERETRLAIVEVSLPSAAAEPQLMQDPQPLVAASQVEREHEPSVSVTHAEPKSAAPVAELHLELEMHEEGQAKMSVPMSDRTDDEVRTETLSPARNTSLVEPPPAVTRPDPVGEAHEREGDDARLKRHAKSTVAAVPPGPIVSSSTAPPPRAVPRRARSSTSRRRQLWLLVGLIAIMIPTLGFYQLISQLDQLDTGVTDGVLAADQAQTQVQDEIAVGEKAVTEPVALPAEMPLAPSVVERPHAAAVSVAVKPAAPKQTPPPAAEREVVALAVPSISQKAQVKPSPAQAAPAPLHIVREQLPDPVYTALRRAYEAYQAGDLIEAERQYRLVTQREANNRDALLGLAAVAQRSARLDEARTWYARVLELNPKDSAAIASLIAIDGNTAPAQNESRIKLLIEQEPAAAHLHFTLGNLYAAQSRWAEAQQAFFNAYHYDPANGDYAFNLAVSLDRMGQGNAALPYYRLALTAAAHGMVQYDPAAVGQRIDNLSRAEN